MTIMEKNLVNDLIDACMNEFSESDKAKLNNIANNFADGINAFVNALKQNDVNLDFFDKLQNDIKNNCSCNCNHGDGCSCNKHDDAVIDTNTTCSDIARNLKDYYDKKECTLQVRKEKERFILYVIENLVPSEKGGLINKHNDFGDLLYMSFSLSNNNFNKFNKYCADACIEIRNKTGFSNVTYAINDDVLYLYFTF